MLPVSIENLLRNPKDSFLESAEIIIRIVDDILENPNNEQVRSIAIDSEEMSKLLTVKGGFESFFEMGFEEGGNCLVYPMAEDLEQLRGFKNVLAEERTKLISKNIMDAFHSSLHNPILSNSQGAVGFVDKKVYPLNILELEQSFYSKLMSTSRKVFYYENRNILEKAQHCLPVEEWKSSARIAFDKYRLDKTTNSHPQLDFRDFLLFELLQWFKIDFFSWVDNPNCDFCNGESEKEMRILTPNDEEKLWDVGIVEGYKCTLCSKEIRFPRFNHPSKLLETRRGRCGEWANCFTLLCRALSFDARLVEDYTDHAWTEVYLYSQKRWVHFDPCEGIWDQPLIYEHGWKKKLTYVIAHSPEETVDVTWRYSSKHQEVLSRRLLCREQWLLDILKKINISKRSALNLTRKKMILERNAIEVAEFLCPRSANESDNKGRTSGSLAWRIKRSECTDDDTNMKPYVFMLTPEEIEKKTLHVQYSSSKDEYLRNSSNVTKGWRKWVYKCSNIFRKIEKDWNMCYLARNEGSDSAHIMWKFDFHSLKVKVDVIKISYSSKVFENGCVVWKLCSDERCLILPSAENTFESSDLRGSSFLSLQADLSLGIGNCAWQHTQLFRQTLSNANEYSFDIYITFV